MFILNKKTGTVQECHNGDAIKACIKDKETYSVAEREADLVKENDQKAEKEPEKEKPDDSVKESEKGADGAPDGNEEGKKAAGEDGKDTSELDEEALSGMKYEELKELAKEKHIPGYGNMNKQTLVAMILNH